MKFRLMSSSEIAPMWPSKPPASEVWRNRAATVTKVEKPTSVQPVHADGFQLPPN